MSELLSGTQTCIFSYSQKEHTSSLGYGAAVHSNGSFAEENAKKVLTKDKNKVHSRGIYRHFNI